MRFSPRIAWSRRLRAPTSGASQQRTVHGVSAPFLPMAVVPWRQEITQQARRFVSQRVVPRSTKLAQIAFDQELRATRDWRQLLFLYQSQHERFDGRNWATLMNQLKKSPHHEVPQLRQDERFHQLLASLERELAGVGGTNLMERFQPQTIANVVHALARLEVRHRAILDIVREQFEITKDTHPQVAANLAWGFATLNYPAPRLFQAIDKEMAATLIRDGTLQAISNTTWAFATQRVDAPRLFQLLDDNAALLLSNEDAAIAPQALSNLAWSFATLGVEAPRLFQQMDATAQIWTQHPTLTPQAIANILWAFASLNLPAPTLFRLVEENAQWVVTKGKPQEIANVAWACATQNMQSRSLFGWINEYAAPLLRSGTPQAIANILWAASKLQYDAPQILKNADSRSEYIIQDGTSQGIANLATAFAELDFVPSFFFEAVERHLDGGLLQSLSIQELCNLQWSLVVLDLAGESPSLLQKLWNQTIERDATKFDEVELFQLLYVQVHAVANGVPLEKVPTALLDFMEKTKSTQAKSSIQSDDKCSSLLSQIGFEHEREVSPFADSSNNFLAIDYANREQRIAIEYDGSFHFLNRLEKGAPPGRESGPTKAKRRLLQKLGWKVVTIPFYSCPIDGSMSDETLKQYLIKRLCEAGVQLGHGDILRLG